MIPSGQSFEPGTERTCQLCGKCVGEGQLTRHFLPRAVARRMRRRKLARRELKRRNPTQTIALCRPCLRSVVHFFLSNGDLGRRYDILEALFAHPHVRRFTGWVRDKLYGRV